MFIYNQINSSFFTNSFVGFNPSRTFLSYFRNRGFCTPSTPILLVAIAVASVLAISARRRALKPQTQSTIIAYALDYRTNTALSRVQEEARIATIRQKTFDTLKDYSSQSSLNDAITPFLKDNLSLDWSNLTITNMKDTPLSGKTKDSVYMIKVKDKVVCFVKAFLSPTTSKGKFLAEISAMKLIEQLAIPHTCPIQPLGFGKYGSGGKEWALLLESPAKGLRLDTYVNGKTSLDASKKAFQRMGRSFAGLHRVKSTSSHPIPQERVKTYEKKLNEVLSNSSITAELTKHMLLGEFKAYVEQVKETITGLHFPYTYCLGDSHLGNMHYDVEGDIFYFIDLAKMHESIGIAGEPLRDGIADLLRLEESAHKKSASHLNEADINSLVDEFYTAYKAEGGSLPDPRLLTFYRTYMKLDTLISYVDKSPAIFAKAVEHFKKKVITRQYFVSTKQSFISRL